VQLEQGLGGIHIFDTEQISPGLQSVFPQQGGLHTWSTQVSCLLQSVVCLQILRGKHISAFTNSKGSGQFTVKIGGLPQIPLSHVVGYAQSESRSQTVGGKHTFKTLSQVYPFVHEYSGQGLNSGGKHLLHLQISISLSFLVSLEIQTTSQGFTVSIIQRPNKQTSFGLQSAAL